MSWKHEKSKFNTAGRWLAWSGVLALVSVGGWLTYFLAVNRPAEPVPVSLITALRRNIETTITEGGTVELREQRTIKSPTAGAVEQVQVKPGQRVKSGQVLLTLRYPERSIALAKQQLQIQQETLTLARNSQKISEAQEQVEAEERKLRQLTPLLQEGAIAQQQVQEQEDAVREAKATLRDAQLEAQTTAIELQSRQLERLGIQQQLRDTIVTAPLDGVVLGINVKDGDGVELRTNLLTLGDPRQVLVKLQLSTLNAAKVRLGQIARVSAIGPNAQTFIGRVQSLGLQAITAEENQKQEGGGSQSQSDQPTVPATVQLDTPTQKLIPGSRVNVEIVVEQRQNVVVLNTEAIGRSGPHAFVWVRDRENKAEKRQVSLGLEGLMTQEVTSGLRPGEQVILPTPELQLQPGMPVISQTDPKSQPSPSP